MKYYSNLFLKMFGIFFLYSFITQLFGLLEFLFLEPINNTKLLYVVYSLCITIVTLIFGILLVFKTSIFIKHLKLGHDQNDIIKKYGKFELEFGIQLLGIYMFFVWMNKTVQLIFSSYQLQYSKRVMGIKINKVHSFISSLSNPLVIAGIITLIFSILMIFRPSLITKIINKSESKS